MNNAEPHSSVPESPGRSAGEVMLALLHAAHTLEGRIECALGTVELSMAKYRLLGLLVEAEGPLALSDLADKANCVRSNITQLVDRLEAEGLVQRIDDPADRRVRRAQLTPQGRARYAEGVRQMESVQAAFTAELPEADRQALARVLAALE